MKTDADMVTLSVAELDSIAHTYALYREALIQRNDVAITLYGEDILAAQARLDIELVDSHATRIAIYAAHNRILGTQEA